jgi:succinyl-CoA synthetase beta subunit
MLRLKGVLSHEEGAITLYVSCQHMPDQCSKEVSGLADPFASHRQPELLSLAESIPPHPLEALAAKAKLFYHKSRRGGNIGCYGYGAGSAMSTMDVLAVVGGRPANFLDGGGGATETNVRAALDVLMRDEDVDVAFVNTFGGLTRTVSL